MATSLPPQLQHELLRLAFFSISIILFFIFLGFSILNIRMATHFGDLRQDVRHRHKEIRHSLGLLRLLHTPSARKEVILLNRTVNIISNVVSQNDGEASESTHSHSHPGSYHSRHEDSSSDGSNSDDTRFDHSAFGEPSYELGLQFDRYNFDDDTFFDAAQNRPSTYNEGPRSDKRFENFGEYDEEASTLNQPAFSELNDTEISEHHFGRSSDYLYVCSGINLEASTAPGPTLEPGISSSQSTSVPKISCQLDGVGEPKSDGQIEPGMRQKMRRKCPIALPSIQEVLASRDSENRQSSNGAHSDASTDSTAPRFDYERGVLHSPFQSGQTDSNQQSQRFDTEILTDEDKKRFGVVLDADFDYTLHGPDSMQDADQGIPNVGDDENLPDETPDRHGGHKRFEKLFFESDPPLARFRRGNHDSGSQEPEHSQTRSPRGTGRVPDAESRGPRPEPYTNRSREQERDIQTQSNPFPPVSEPFPESYRGIRAMYLGIPERFRVSELPPHYSPGPGGLYWVHVFDRKPNPSQFHERRAEISHSDIETQFVRITDHYMRRPSYAQPYMSTPEPLDMSEFEEVDLNSSSSSSSSFVLIPAPRQPRQRSANPLLQLEQAPTPPPQSKPAIISRYLWPVNPAKYGTQNTYFLYLVEDEDGDEWIVWQCFCFGEDVDGEIAEGLLTVADEDGIISFQEEVWELRGRGYLFWVGEMGNIWRKREEWVWKL
ncbi:hypothetical protein P154DRAFT_540385 [Amniculicola lignicola CBS 123094]|uniref:Uncharacterized protein n=1 Tax=Amniculicola lignicola CBS 123094 TaxID=1392246 RepID=A0A6A5W756_9PLEO|nr:hypothetical protein P154DRAFT_540385 [Amniculicola lignicola CBS 123094]